MQRWTWHRALIALTIFACVHPSVASFIDEFILLNTFKEGSFSAGHVTASYKVWLPAGTPNIKVVLLPLSGDADALVSFDPNATSVTTANAATWSMVGSGPEELLIRQE